jgi:hypothetical protein
MKERFDLFQQKQNNDISELKAAIEFLRNNDNAAIISDSSSEIISNEKAYQITLDFLQ